jgi:hypothetical protein
LLRFKTWISFSASAAGPFHTHRIVGHCAPAHSRSGESTTVAASVIALIDKLAALVTQMKANDQAIADTVLRGTEVDPGVSGSLILARMHGPGGNVDAVHFVYNKSSCL